MGGVMQRRRDPQALKAYLKRVLTVWLSGFATCAFLWALSEGQTWYAALIGVCLIGLTVLIFDHRMQQHKANGSRH